MNSRVQKWVNLFNGNLKGSFNKWVHRIGLYGPTIEAVLDEEGAPRDLIYLAMIESGFNMKAASHASAVGPWQFIRSTGKMYGLNAGVFVDERKDIMQASHAAARHLKDLYKIYGDWYLAFSAYNAGPGKTNSAIRRGHSKNYWKLTGRRSKLFRQETKDYVPKVLAALHIVKNYRKYGYTEKSFGRPLHYDKVTVPDATDITVIANSAETTPKVIAQLNPNLNFGITPPGQRFSIYVPKGAKEEFLKNYARVPASKRVSSLQYVAGRKDTVASIAKRYNLSASRIARLNGKKSNQRLKYGTIIRIPASKSSLMAMAKTGGRSGYRSKTRVVYHRIRSGDTLSRIARKYKTSVRKVAKWNKLNKKSRLRVGRKLKIYRKGGSYKSAPTGRFVATNYKKSSRKRVSGVNHIINLDQKNPAKFKASSKPSKINIPTMVAVAHNSKSKSSRFEPAMIKTLEGELIGQEALDVPSKKVAKKKVRKTRYHVVKRGDTLSGIASKYRLRVSTLKSFNNLRSNNIRLKQRLVVKPGSNAKAAYAIKQPKVQPQRKTYYTVRANDNLLRISKRHGVSVTKIKSINGLKSNNIRVGQRLLIKGKGRVATRVAKASPVQRSSSKSVYIVKANDTLSGIALKTGSRVADIKSWNRMTSNNIRAGQKLRVLKSSSNRPQRVASDKVIYHRVQSGETLWSLSKKYRVKISDIMKWNNMKSDRVRPKQRLKIIA